MREPLLPYKGHDRINFLCLIATEMMGESHLTRMPALLAGFESICHTLDGDVAMALKNIRIAGFAPVTLRELALMVDGYRNHHRRLNECKSRGDEDAKIQMAQRFVIDENLLIRKLWTHVVPDDVKEALKALMTPLPIRSRTLIKTHDATMSAEVQDEYGYSGYITSLGFVPPEPALYDISRLGRAPGTVRWQSLIQIARQFDDIDLEAGRQNPGEDAWFRRLHDLNDNPTAILLKASESGLVTTDGIELTGLKHLIGLPGSGKTTLLYLLAGYLARNGYSVCFLFPSIEVATGFIETLGRYDIEVGLLSGQGESSRTRHALNFATAMAGQNRGFGTTRSVAQFFATNCALAGFTSDEEADFPHNNPPCMKVLQREKPQKRARPHRCALSSVCGYQYSERKLIDTRLWAGHVLSTDRNVSKLFSDIDLRHFEFIARTFDLMVVDECDGAQNSLDVRGTPIMRLVGDKDSLWNTLIRDIHQPAAGGRNAFVAGETLPTLLEMTGRFGRATERFVGRITHFSVKFRAENANVLLTSLSIIADMFSDENDGNFQRRHDARQALERIWDAAVKRVAFRHDLMYEDEDEVDLDRMISETAELLNAPQYQVLEFHRQLLLAIERWERDGNDAAVKELAATLRKIPNLSSPLDDETFFYFSGLLVAVSLVVLQHFGLAPHLRLMNSEGLVSDNVFESRPSRDQMAILPESLIGRLSGVRYTISEEGNVDVSHVSFAGTPRMLPERMIRLSEENGAGGMAVLLTSATSMLEQSPSFHVAAGPHYVLQRPNAGYGWKDSHYTFFPKMDPQNGGVPLRFSGAKMSQRETILKSMVNQLLHGGTLGDVATAISENNVVDGTPRKAAFVVNSYDQCELLYSHIQANHPSWRGRVRYLTRATIHSSVNDHAVTAAEVEQLGKDRSWDLLIFPMNAIGRGVNIVFQYGPRINKAMIGSLFFLTRPHPRSDSLQLIQGLVGRASEIFDQKTYSNTPEALIELRDARKEAVHMAEYLLRMPLVAQSLGQYAEPFVADQMIIILQTIGRAMRGDCPAFVYFVDAAWAPNSARGLADSERTSMLVMMQSILKKCLNHSEPAKRECYCNLYQSFAEPLNAISNLITART
ncbi:hypothetical protein QLH52_04075 [Methylomonas sp. OY6]|uniref:Uncharacterized protein n=1 Tax=Methylomonas defluvii TaxID=3045149 RepID=A0ABU4UCA8_9GAMM|nr:hypothetical protein [Methylomonas sp. OY6]MDX8126445.1 hypothetical protein [Methylomonas sp. OY6]